MFSRVRKGTSGEKEDNAKTENARKSESDYVELGQTENVHHTGVSTQEPIGALEPEDSITVLYREEANARDISYKVEGKYYSYLVNNIDITVKDLNVIPRKDNAISESMYIYFVLIIGLFYIIPATQVSYFTFEELSHTGIQDICFYNFKCDGRVGSIHGFNNIWSNIGYFMIGVLFFLITVVKNISFVREVRAEGVRTTGIPQTFGIYYSISFAMIFEAILSSIYHLCPSLTNNLIQPSSHNTHFVVH